VRFFREAVPAERLGLLRVLVGLFVVTAILTRRTEVMGLLAGTGAHYQPVGVLRFFTPPSEAQIRTLQLVLPVLGLLWTAGLFWRVVGPLFGVAFLVWASWRLSWGSVSHDLHVATLFVLVLSFSPATQGLSLDARFRTPLAERPGPPWTQAWPVKLLAVLTAATYVLAGWSKVNTPAGFGWASGENLLSQVAYARLVAVVYQPDLPPDPVLTWVGSHPWILRFGATTALFLELGAPLALLGGRVRTAWAVGIVAMHQGIRMLMGIAFPFHSLGFVVLPLFPLERLLPARFRPSP
jgi:hypothetical protein